MTELVSIGPDLEGKRLELLTQIVPQALVRGLPGESGLPMEQSTRLEVMLDLKTPKSVVPPSLLVCPDKVIQ